MPSIADLFISVSSDVSGAINGLTDVDRKVNGTTQAMQAAAPAGYALAAAAGAVAAGFISSVAVASDFEHQINGIKAVMSPEEVQIYGAAVEDLAIKLGRDTVFSASEAAGAIEEMIKAGVPLPAILGGAAQSALDLAAATGVDVAQAAQLASTAMNTYHQSAEQLPAIMDTIANVSNATAISVQDLQFGLAAVGPVAAGIGLDFQDTATALGVFANNGLRGSDAGTSLKTMLLNLQPDTKASVSAFKELGLITEETGNKFFDAEGQVRPMNEIFQILKESTAGLTDQMKIQLLQQAFGTDAVRAATIAAAEGAAGWDKVTEAMDKMGGTAVAAAQRQQGLEGAMNQLNGSFEAIQITVGQFFLPIMTNLAQTLTMVLNAFLSLDPGIQGLIVAVTGIAGAVAGMAAGWVLLGPIITAVGAAFGIIAAAASPVLLVLAALVAAGAALYLAWQNDFGGIRAVTEEVWQAIQPGLVNIQNFLRDLVAQIGPALAAFRESIQPLITALEPLVAIILAQLPGAVRAAGDAFNALGVVIQNLTPLWQVLGQVIGTNLNAIIQVATLFLDTITALLQGDFERVLRNMVETVRIIGLAIIENLAIWGRAFLDLVEHVFPQLTPAIEGALSGIQNLLAGMGDLFGPLIEQAWAIGTRLGEAFVNFLSFIGQAISGIPEMITGLGDIWEPFITGAWEIGTRIGEAFVNFLSFIGQAISGIPAMIEGLGDLWAPFVNGAWEVGTRIGEAIQNVLNFIFQAIGGIPDLLSGLGDIFGFIVQAAWELGSRIAEAIEPIRQLLIDTFGSFWNFLTGAVQLPGGGTAPPGGGGTPLPSPGTGGPIVSIGTLIISSEAEAQAFLDQVAAAVLASANRVSPPLTGANPALP